MNARTLALALIATLPAIALADTPGTLLAKFAFDKPDTLGPWHEELKPAQEPSDLAIDTANPHSGPSALKYRVKADVDSQRDIYTGVALAPNDAPSGRRLRFRFWARTDGAAKGDASLRVLERGPSGVIGWLDNKVDAVVIDKGATWSEYSVDAPLKDATSMLTLQVAIAHASAGKAVWIDDLSVEQIPGAAK